MFTKDSIDKGNFYEYNSRLVVGVDMVTTEPSEDMENNVVALDCEMVFTTGGLEVAKLTLVGRDLEPLVDEYVCPHNAVLDYITDISGVTKEHMDQATHTLFMVQQLLKKHIHKDTIIVGHSLECDLKALRIAHYKVVDTAVVFKRGKNKPSLKDLCEQFFQKPIQAGPGGHSSLEDASAAMNLMLHKITATS